MGMTQNQLGLVRAVAENKYTEAKKYAISCCVEDNTQKNKSYVERYKKMLSTGSLNTIELPPNIKGIAIMEDLSNTFIEGRYYLSKREKEVFETIEKMHMVSLQLMERRIPYLNATLLYGESGVGKTTFGKYVAYKLGMPYMYINFSTLIDSYLGGTSKNLNNIFSFVNQNECVLMLDEIDCIANNRKGADSSAAKEMARSTTCLLQILDTITNDHVIIGATNLPNEIDPAVKRRFTLHHEINRLNKEENEEFILSYLKDAGFIYDKHEVGMYAAEDHSQAEIMTYITRCMAGAIMNGNNKVVLINNSQEAAGL